MMPNPDPTRAATPDATRTSADPSTVSHPTDGEPGTATMEEVRALEALRNGAPVPSPTAVEPPPGFVLEGELGVGGMGVVYLARQVGLNRPVALKLVKGGTAVDSKALIRFLAEAEVVAAVKHPNVVEVYQYGEHAGKPYMALEYCPGGDLTTLVNREAKTSALKDAAWFRRVADLMAKVADGVNAAHAQGIVHRDLKPHNVFLATDGTPKVADFGLAKRGVGSDLTNTQAVMGTPAYVAPEQAGGGTKFVGPEADVWALGVMLYELACGERPIDTSGPLLDAIARVAKGEVPKLGTKAPTVPTDLSLIAHKCLSPDPRDRYPTAGGLAADLRNWLDGKPISARRAGTLEQAIKWVRRKPTLATAYIGILAMVFLLCVVIVLVSLWQEAESAKRLATQAQAEVERAREKVARVEYGRTIQVAHQAWVENDASEAVALLAATDPELRGWEWDYIHRLCNGQVLEVKGIHLADMSDDGTRLVTAESTEHGDRVVLWAVPSGVRLFELPVGRHNSKRVKFSGDGRRLLTAGSGDEGALARVWDTSTGREVAHFPTTNPAFATLTADGKRVFASDKETVNVWEVEGGRKLAELGGHSGQGVFGIWASPNGLQAVTLFAADQSYHCRLWDLTGEPKPQPLTGHERPITAVEFSRDGDTLCTCSYGQTILHDPSGAIRTRVPREMASNYWFALSADGRRIVSVGENDTLHLWEEGKGRLWASPIRHTAGAYRFAFSTNGRRIVTGSDDMTARVWDVENGKELYHLKGHTGKLERVAVTADGNCVLTLTGDTARVWDIRRLALAEMSERTIPPDQGCEIEWSGRRFDVYPDSRGSISWGHEEGNGPPESEKPVGGSFSLDGKRAAVAFKGGRVLLWDRPGRRAIATLTAVFDIHPLVRFSSDGSKLFCGETSVGQVWDADTGAKLGAIAQQENTGIESVVFSADGTTLATGSGDSTVRLHDATTGTLLIELKGHSSGITHLAFDPSGKRLATAFRDHTVRLWDVPTGKELAVMKGHTAEITSLAFHPSGNRIATGAEDCTVRLWDTASGAEVFKLKGAKGGGGDFLVAKVGGWGYLVRFSEDGKQLLTSTDGTTFKVWDSTTMWRGAGR